MDLEKLEKEVLPLVSHLSDNEKEIRKTVIQRLLSDYDFLDDPDETTNINPSDILNRYLNTFFEFDTGKRAYSEWFSLLALFCIEQIREKGNSSLFFPFANHAHDLAVSYDERAAAGEHRQKAANRKKGIELNKKKYAPNERLRTRAFKDMKLP